MLTASIGMTMVCDMSGGENVHDFSITRNPMDRKLALPSYSHDLDDHATRHMVDAGN